MNTFRHIGGEEASAGTYWNFESGEKIMLREGDILPGDSKKSYYRASPWIIMAIGAACLHLLVYVLPGYLMPLYAAYAEKLLLAYVSLDYVFISVVIAGIALTAFGDMGSILKTGTFGWKPGEAYLAGEKDKDRDKKEKK